MRQIDVGEWAQGRVNMLAALRIPDDFLVKRGINLGSTFDDLSTYEIAVFALSRNVKSALIKDDQGSPGMWALFVEAPAGMTVGLEDILNEMDIPPSYVAYRSQGGADPEP